MPSVTYDPQTGHMLVDGQPVALSGTNPNYAQTPYSQRGLYITYDTDGTPMFFDPNMARDEGGQLPASAYTRLTDAQRQRLAGRQIVGRGIGGPGEAINWQQVEYDPELGFLTDTANIKPIKDSMLQSLMPAIVGGIGAGIVLGPGMLGGVGAAGDSFVPGFIAAGEGDAAAVAAGLNSGGGAALGSYVPGFIGAGEGDAAAVAAGLNSGGGAALGSYPLLPNITLPDMSGWALNAPTGGSGFISQLLGGDLSGAATTAGQWLSNPTNLGRLGLAGASLLGGGQQQPASGGYTPWTGTPYDFSGGGAQAGGTENPYTAAQLAAYQAEDSMGYYGYPQMRSSYGPYPSGGVGQLLGYGGGQRAFSGDYMGGGINPQANGGWGMGSMRSALGNGSSGPVPQGYGFDAWGGTPDQGSGNVRSMPYFPNGGFNPGAGMGGAMAKPMSKPFTGGQDYGGPAGIGSTPQPAPVIQQGPQGWATAEQMSMQGQEGTYDPIAAMRGRLSQTDQNQALQEASRLRMLQGIQGGSGGSLEDMMNARWGSMDLSNAIGAFRGGRGAPVDLTGEQARMLQDASLQRSRANPWARGAQQFLSNPNLMALLGR